MAYDFQMLSYQLFSEFLQSSFAKKLGHTILDFQGDFLALKLDLQKCLRLFVQTAKILKFVDQIFLMKILQRMDQSSAPP